jgi:deoxyribodipyrimidine photo-lyase
LLVRPMTPLRVHGHRRPQPLRRPRTAGRVRAPHGRPLRARAECRSRPRRPRRRGPAVAPCAPPLLLESELVGTALALHGPQQAEKFIQEVFWRSYWKGYLQLRPRMWREHLDRVASRAGRAG